MSSDDDFRVSFRDEMDALRNALRQGDSCSVEVYKNVRRENRNEEFRESEVDFHRDVGAQTDESNFKNEKGGICQ
jgi:hypothetical protein